MAIVNFESVATAAEALQSAGQRASVRGVIAALGGGSPNSVLKLLGEWKAGRPVVRIADTELDHRITDAIKVQMQRVAEQAAAAAEERAAAIDEDLQALAEAQAWAEQQITALTAERDTAQCQAADFVEQLKEVQAEAARNQEQAAQSAAALRQELAGERARLEASASELARAQVRLEALPGLQADIEHLRATLRSDAEQSAQALAICQQARQAAEQSAAVLAAEMKAAECRVGEAQMREKAMATRLEEAEKQARQAVQAAHSAQLQIQVQQTALDAAVRDLDAMRRQVADSSSEAKKAGEAAAELRGKLAAMNEASGKEA